jgi:hypothetical protein
LSVDASKGAAEGWLLEEVPVCRRALFCVSDLAAGETCIPVALWGFAGRIAHQTIPATQTRLAITAI